MKKNYYSIHKNKKPKRITPKRQKPNIHILNIIMKGVIGAMHLNQIKITMCNPEEKKLLLLDSLIDTANVIIKDVKKLNWEKFNKTKKYRRYSKTKSNI